MSPRFAGRLVVRVSAGDVGRRVSLRRRLPDGTLTDVVGILEDWSAGEVTVRRRDGSPVTFPAASLVAGKIAPPAPPRSRERPHSRE
jgi:hypothetical protein